MRKKGILIFIIVTIFLILFSFNIVYGFSIEDLSGTKSGQEGRIENFGQGVIKIVTTVGSICSVIFLIILGIKYMIGSTEERADYKKSLLPYIIGASIVFAASNIASIIYKIAIDL